MSTTTQQLHNTDFLLSEFTKTIDFHLDNDIDYLAGGYYQQLYSNGDAADKTNRSLVSTTRGIMSYAYASILCDKYPTLKDKSRACKIACAHGLTFLQTYFQQPNEGYAWELEINYNKSNDIYIPNIKVSDNKKMCYGHAFVHAAIAAAVQANICSIQLLHKSWNLLEKYFYCRKEQLYYAEIDANWSKISDYRGQNCNMHMTEAMIIAYEATSDIKYLNRAILLSKRLMIDLPQQSKYNLCWEHYTKEWKIDYDYNKNDPRNLLRPWGYLPGHFAEWSKLLTIIYNFCNDNKLNNYQRKQILNFDRENNNKTINSWMIDKAILLFNYVIKCWDKNKGGIFYTYNTEMMVFDTDKYMWSHPEAFCAAYLLAKFFEDKNKKKTKFYMNWFNVIYKYCDEYLIDPKGGWYGVLDMNNKLKCNKDYGKGEDPETQKSWFGDYHSMGAIYQILVRCANNAVSKSKL